MSYIQPKNWDSFQHYKDRSPSWIKLHKDLIDNQEYACLSPLCGKYLPLIWLICSEFSDGIVPANPAFFAFRLRISTLDAESIIAECLSSGFFVMTGLESKKATGMDISKANGYSSRYISKITKDGVFERDNGSCVMCGDTETIEYDHVIPVSKGGGSGIDNVQLLCRRCNRKKRNKLSAEQDDTEQNNQRSLEKRREEEEIEKEKLTSSAKANDLCPQSEIIELYHEQLPVMPRVREWTKARQTKLRARWKESTDRQTLDWWREFFGYVGKSDFLCGRTAKPFTCNLEWLVTQSNFAKVLEGNYENRGVAA